VLQHGTTAVVTAIEVYLAEVLQHGTTAVVTAIEAWNKKKSCQIWEMGSEEQSTFSKKWQRWGFKSSGMLRYVVGWLVRGFISRAQQFLDSFIPEDKRIKTLRNVGKPITQRHSVTLQNTWAFSKTKVKTSNRATDNVTRQYCVRGALLTAVVG
jgi:hypothetical protein